MSKRWLSALPKRLKELEGTRTAGQAITQLVDRRLRVLGSLSPPVNLAMVASTCGIKPKFLMTKMNQDARLVIIDGSYHIQVNSTHEELRHRFSIAHEITHKIIADATNDTLMVKSRKGFSYLIQDKDLELLCNIGARHILLLRPECLRPVIQSSGFSQLAISELEDTYEVSFEAAARSLAETALDKVAVVYFIMGYRKNEVGKANQLVLLPNLIDTPEPRLRVTRYYKSETFDITIPLNKSVPEDSWITEAFHSDQTKTATEILAFNYKQYHQFDVEAIPRFIYVDGSPQKGIITLLSNPVQLP